MKISPFEAIYGYQPSSLPLIQLQDISVEGVSIFLQSRQHMSQLIQDNLLEKRSDREFQVGDLVCLKLQPYRQASLTVRKALKLAAEYYGPY